MPITEQTLPDATPPLDLVKSPELLYQLDKLEVLQNSECPKAVQHSHVLTGCIILCRFGRFGGAGKPR